MRRERGEGGTGERTDDGRVAAAEDSSGSEGCFTLVWLCKSWSSLSLAYLPLHRRRSLARARRRHHQNMLAFGPGGPDLIVFRGQKKKISEPSSARTFYGLFRRT